RLDALRPRDDQRPGAAGELCVKQQERQTGEMIAVEMRDQGEIDWLSRNAEGFQRRQRCGAAIDQEIDRGARDVKASGVAAAGADRTAAADELQLHRLPGPPLLFVITACQRSASAARPGSRSRRRAGSSATAS